MRIQEINFYNTKQNNKITFQSKTFLTKPNLQPKIDLFCKSPEVKEGLMNKFINLREELSKDLYPKFLKYSISQWDFYINSTDENLEKMNKDFDEYNNIWQNKDLYNKFLKLKNIKLDKHEKKQLKEILKSFEEELLTGEDLKILNKKENEISQKYNSYIPKIDNKEVSKAEITKILETEKNPELRKKAYEANITGGDLIAEDLKELVILRNEFAVKKGYPNYFEYMLKEGFDVDSKELEILLNDVYNKSKNLIKTEIEKEKEEISKVFGIKKEDLKAYHYGLLTENNPEKKANDYIKNKEQILEIAKKTYQCMGYDIENLEKEGKLILDLYPRKNKNTHAFSFDIDAGNDARILANITKNVYSLKVLLHELGHSIYTIDISRDLPYIDRTTYPALNEAVAILMEDLQKKENILSDLLPENILEEYKNNFKNDEFKFLTKALTLINFEKEMYKNPNQDLAKLWHDMKIKYQNINESEEKDNGWATIPHFLGFPAYYQNYFRAHIMKAQIYNYLTEKLGNITENPKTAKILKEELLKYGKNLEENELIENMTGKKLSVEDYIKSITN